MDLQEDFEALGLYALLVLGIALLLFTVCMLVVPKIPNIDKSAKYECGFSPRETVKT